MTTKNSNLKKELKLFQIWKRPKKSQIWNTTSKIVKFEEDNKF